MCSLAYMYAAKNSKRSLAYLVIKYIEFFAKAQVPKARGSLENKVNFLSSSRRSSWPVRLAVLYNKYFVPNDGPSNKFVRFSILPMYQEWTESESFLK